MNYTNHMNRQYASILVLCLTFPTLAIAQSLKERQDRQDQEVRLRSETETTESRCGLPDLAVSIDWGAAKPSDLENNSAYLWCDDALNALESVCSDELGKAAVTEKVKKVVCTFGKRAVKVADGTLTYTIDFAETNNEEFVSGVLKSSL